jgi:Fic-DOC domain mobile mystery protein B
MAMRGQEPPGNTPIDDDEAADLIPGHLRTRSELNAWEQVNISEAVSWLQGKRLRPVDILELKFLLELHRRMFGRTWAWAGKQRSSGKSIGVPKDQIAEGLRNLTADTRYWIERRTFGLDELAARFHHRLVVIHAFPNGNGRHARLATDLLLESLGAEPFTWGSADLDQESTARSRYLQALRDADNGSYESLLGFVRT